MSYELLKRAYQMLKGSHKQGAAQLRADIEQELQKQIRGISSVILQKRKIRYCNMGHPHGEE
jgi:hypothetical protein